MNIKMRLIGSVALISLIIVGMFAATWVVTSSQKDDSLIINLAGRQRMLSQKLAKETLAYGASGNAAYKANIEKTIAVFESTLMALSDSGNAPLSLDPAGAKASLPAASPAVYAQLGKVKKLWVAYRQNVEEAVASGQPDVTKLSAISLNVLKEMNSAVGMMQKESEGRVTTLLIVQMVGVGVGIIIVLIVLISLNSRLTTPLSNLQNYAGEVAKGNLDAKIEGDYVKELLVLKNSIVTMVENIKENIAEVASQKTEAERNASTARKAKEAAEKQQEQVKELLDAMAKAAQKASAISHDVAGSVTELASQVDEVNHGTDVQRDRMTETATAMEEMNATVLEVANNASNAAEAAARARENAQTGAEGVRQAVTSIDAIKDQILDLNESMSELGQQAESIGHIMNVVTDIADQTNLLALNAAIEAARAGEAGRGFAVVADEVRKLAEKTMDATKEVGGAVNTIQEQARSNIRAVENSVKDIVKSTEAASESGRFMDEIVAIVEDTANMVESIATASEEQSAASEEINQAVADVTRVASETAEGMALAAKKLDSMAAMTSDLDVVIRDMSTGSAQVEKAGRGLKEIEAELKVQGLRMSDRSGLRASDSSGMMQWTDELSTNIREIDEQHIRLINLINALQKAMVSGKGKEAVAQVLEELKDYTVFHFAHEETLFEEYDYPETEGHVQAHKMFVEKVVEFEQKILSGKASVTMEVLDFLKDWLVKHIMGVDHRYSPYFNKKGLY
ncbi:bacteriohemerythrin [Pseudodesulfovibrio sp. zrk46]|uniref:bacteriohemerythrin n=1 Tax=Pseudodesulfovibrio sp. zrk46 TaxID=2725288 RepID=UPI0014492F5C|nr:bacteriohemerythrin [Pseudodesulfovibrio sp. zrk46]QJB55022.1 bacteriohemerythrin [Pseudodesulfovibrio sp. zrk46]